MSARTAIASVPNSAWPWPCATQGKEVVCWNEDSVPHKYAFLDPDKVMQKPKRGQEFDCVIATDCATFERLGSIGTGRRQRARSSSTSTITRATPAMAI